MSDEHLIRRLIVGAGVHASAAEAMSWRVLRHAAPKDKEMSAVYDYVNQDLLNLLESGSMGVVHITGEARVLVDPQARRVIRNNFAVGGVQTRVVLQQQRPLIVDAFTFVAGVKPHWKGLTLVDLIDIASMASEGALMLAIADHNPPVHYSLFGANRVLLQEPQRDQTERKRVWYLESESLVHALATCAEEKIQGAQSVPILSFQKFVSWLTSEPIDTLLREPGTFLTHWNDLESPDQAQLWNAGLVALRDGRLTATVLPGFPVVATSSRESAVKVVQPTLGRDADSRVLMLSQREGDGSQYGAVAGDLLQERGLTPVSLDEYLIADEEFEAALEYSRVLALVTSVGTAAETLHFVHHQRVSKALNERRRVPEIAILVPKQYMECFFGRAIVEAYSGNVRALPEDNTNTLDIRNAIEEVIQSWERAWTRAEESRILSQNAPRGLDEQARRSGQGRRRVWNTL